MARLIFRAFALFGIIVAVHFLAVQIVMAAEGCASQLVSQPEIAGASRTVTAKDIAMLRDIGQPTGNSAFDARQFSVSPDKSQIAFFLRRADPATNSYCQGIFVLALHPGAVARLVDSGGELIRDEIPNLRGLRLPTGWPAANVPLWSPDGRSLAYLRREQGVTQIWHVAIDGSRSEAITSETADVEGFLWSPSGRSLLFASSEPLAEWRQRSAQDGLAGYRFDKSYVPAASDMPLPPGNLGSRYFSVDVATRMRVPATADEQSLFKAMKRPGVPDGALGYAEGPRDSAAWVAPTTRANPYALQYLYVRRGTAAPIACGIPSCQDLVTDFWWDERSDSLLYLALTGPADSDVALFRWRGDSAPPIKLFETKDLLIGCVYLEPRLLCERETARDPRTLVWVDIGSGRQTEIFNPNPEFGKLARGKVWRLFWKNDLGLDAFGDLVLPPSHNAGQRHPLIVVQYLTKGFLRGGVGDEYPIHAFAARGFAVLSFNRPKHFAESVVDPLWTERSQGVAVDTKGWADRRSVLSSLLKGVELAEATGTIDPARIGITGMSDGSSSAIFALINSHVFAAGALSTCCEDPKTLLLEPGPAWLENRYKAGYAHYSDGAPDFWKPISLAMNAKTIAAPLLLQLPSDEYHMAIETFASFKDHDRPIDMYVFPNEHHAKYQPAHRLAIYERNLDWFDFWLQGKVDPDVHKAEQYRHWEDLRKAAEK